MIAGVSQSAILTCVAGVTILATAVVLIARLARDNTSAMDMLLRTTILTLLLLPLVQFFCGTTQLGWRVPRGDAAEQPLKIAHLDSAPPSPAPSVQARPTDLVVPAAHYQNVPDEKLSFAPSKNDTINQSTRPSILPAIPMGEVTEEPTMREPIDWPWVLGILWAIGIGALTVRSLPARFVLFRICRVARKLSPEESTRIRQLGIASLPSDRLRVTASIHGPAVAGVWNPVILLPADLFDLDDATVKSAILHEQAHIQRNDPMMLAAAQLLTTLWWFHPSVWFLSASFRRTTETMCDNHAIESAGSIHYAETLLHLSDRYKSNHAHALSLSMLGKQTRLERRIASLLNPERDARTRATWKTKLAAVIPIAFLGLISASQLWGQPPEEPKQPSEKTPGEVEPVLAAKDSVPPWTIHGVVIDNDSGKPVAGADVFARIGWKGDPDAQTISDAAGKFFFQNVKHELIIVWATTDTMTSGTRYSSEDASFNEDGTLKAPVTLKLHRGTKVRVRVIDAKTDQPIAGAKVYGAWMQPYMTDVDGYTWTNPLSGKSDNHIWSIRARAPRYGEAIQDIDIRAAKQGDLVTLKMLPGITLEGKITDALNEKPIDNASVMVNIPGRHSFWLTSKSTDGTYQITDVPNVAGLTLMARCNIGYELFSRPVEVAPDSHTHSQDIQMQRIARGGQWSAHVYSGDGPIASASVELKSRKDQSVVTKETNKNGDVYFKDLYLDDEGYDVWLRADGFAARREIHIAPWNGEGKQKTHQFRLNQGHTLRIRVVDEDNQPIEKAHVRVSRTGIYQRSDANGLVRFDGLEETDMISVSANNFSDNMHQLLEMNTEKPVDVVMKPAGWIKLEVVDSNDKPIPRYVVNGWFTTDWRPNDAKGSISHKLSQVGIPIMNEDGEGLIPDWSLNQAAMLFVSADGYRRGVVTRVVATAKSKVKATKVVLEPIDAAKTKTVAGKLLRPDGTPAAGARIAIIVSQPNETPTFSWDDWNREIHLQPAIERVERKIVDTEGKFSFAKIPEGGSIWLAYDGNVPRQLIRNLETKTDTELASLSLKTSVAAEIKLVRGQAVEGKTISYTIEDGEGNRVKNDNRILPNECVIAKNLSPGRYEITVSVDGRQEDYTTILAQGEHGKIHFPRKPLLKQLANQEKPLIRIRPVEVVKQILGR